MKTHIALATFALAAFAFLGNLASDDPERWIDDEEEEDEEEVVRTRIAYDIYDLKIKLKVPQVLNNTENLGKRNYVR